MVKDGYMNKLLMDWLTLKIIPEHINFIFQQ